MIHEWFANKVKANDIISGIRLTILSMIKLSLVISICQNGETDSHIQWKGFSDDLPFPASKIRWTLFTWYYFLDLQISHRHRNITVVVPKLWWAHVIVLSMNHIFKNECTTCDNRLQRQCGFWQSCATLEVEGDICRRLMCMRDKELTITFIVLIWSSEYFKAERESNTILNSTRTFPQRQCISLYHWFYWVSLNGFKARETNHIGLVLEWENRFCRMWHFVASIQSWYWSNTLSRGEWHV
jgi:hypothetical protein